MLICVVNELLIMNNPVYNGGGKGIRFGDIYYLFHRGSGNYLSRPLSSGFQNNEACELAEVSRNVSPEDNGMIAVRIAGGRHDEPLNEGKEFTLLCVNTTYFLSKHNDKLVILDKNKNKYGDKNSKFVAHHCNPNVKGGAIHLNVDGEWLYSPTNDNKNLLFDKNNPDRNDPHGQQAQFEFINVE